MKEKGSAPDKGRFVIGEEGAVAKPAYRKRILIESFEQSERSLQRLRRWFGN